MNDNISYNLVVKSEESGVRLDKYIATHISTISRTRVQELIKQKLITTNGLQTKLSYKVNTNDKINIEIPSPQPLSLDPENLNLDIIYEDDDVIVVNKPQGMVVHPSAGHPDHTLVNGLIYHTKNLAKCDEIFRPGIVHRIDKDTSGLLMIAKNATARISLEKQLANKIHKREYIAIVHDNFKHSSGVIDAPIGRNPYQRQQMAVVASGKKAITHFTVLEQFPGYSLVKCVLETGRTHQIRVHMSYIGHPIAGDPLYGPKKTLNGNGQFLHAKTLGFYHPKTNQWLEFSISEPQIFAKQLYLLRKKLTNNLV